MTDKEKLSCLTDRPCSVCRHKTENGCNKWACVFGEESVAVESYTVGKLDHILKWGYCFCDNDDNEYCKAIKNAIEIITALETLKAEIRDNTNHCECVPDGSCISVNKVLEIIDGHIKVSDTPKPQEWVIDFRKMRAEIADYKGSHCIHLLDPDDLIGEILAIVDRYTGGAANE